MKSDTRNQLSAIGKIIGTVNFEASLSVVYLDRNESIEQSIEISFTAEDPEFQEFLNAWGARKAAELLRASA